jgi:hypothetical protein
MWTAGRKRLGTFKRGTMNGFAGTESVTINADVESSFNIQTDSGWRYYEPGKTYKDAPRDHVHKIVRAHLGVKTVAPTLTTKQ